MNAHTLALRHRGICIGIARVQRHAWCFCFSFLLFCHFCSGTQDIVDDGWCYRAVNTEHRAQTQHPAQHRFTYVPPAHTHRMALCSHFDMHNVRCIQANRQPSLRTERQREKQQCQRTNAAATSIHLRTGCVDCVLAVSVFKRPKQNITSAANLTWSNST